MTPRPQGPIHIAPRPSSSGQDIALSRREQGFDSPWARQSNQNRPIDCFYYPAVYAYIDLVTNRGILFDACRLCHFGRLDFCSVASAITGAQLNPSPDPGTVPQNDVPDGSAVPLVRMATRLVVHRPLHFGRCLTMPLQVVDWLAIGEGRGVLERFHQKWSALLRFGSATKQILRALASIQSRRGSAPVAAPRTLIIAVKHLIVPQHHRLAIWTVAS